MKEFYSREHHSIVKERHIEPDGFKLGAKVKGLVNAYESNKLEQAWIKYLEDDLDFKWDTSKFWWLAQYVGLRRWARKNRRCSPPKGTRVKIRVAKNWQEERDINQFRNGCVTSYKYWEKKDAKLNYARKKAPKKLTSREITALEKIPFWSWDLQKDKNQEFLDRLDEYLKTDVVSNLKNHTKHNGYGLGARLTKIRTKYKKGNLNSAIKAILVDKGIDLDPFETAWSYKFDLAKDYLSSNKQGYVPQDTIFKGEAIGTWLTKQRSEFKKGNLIQTRIKRLETIPGWEWDISDKAAHKISQTQN